MVPILKQDFITCHILFYAEYSKRYPKGPVWRAFMAEHPKWYEKCFNPKKVWQAFPSFLYGRYLPQPYPTPLSPWAANFKSQLVNQWI